MSAGFNIRDPREPEPALTEQQKLEVMARALAHPDHLPVPPKKEASK